MSIIDIENLRYDYVRAAEEGNVTVSAIRGIDLSVEPGSFTAVIGRNGSGKSTLAKNLNGLLLPTEGVVRVDGWDTRDD